METLKFADVFCGAGGLSIGLVESGMRDIISCDFWDVAKENYTSYSKLSESRFYQINMHDKKQRKELIDAINSNQIDVLAGGPPCQGFSTLGKRENKDKRNELVDAYLDVVKKTKTKVIIMENVPAMQSMVHESGEKYPEYVVNFLNKQGYYATRIFIEGKMVNLSQTRKRLFIIAFKKSHFKKIDDYERELSKIIDKNIIRSEYKTVKESIGDLPRLKSNEGKEIIEINEKKIYNHRAFKYNKKIIDRISKVPKNGGLQDIPNEFLSNHLIKMKQGKYGSGGFVKNLYGRLDWNKPSGTIVAGIKKVTAGRFFHPVDNRLLTVREAARLQSFPDDYLFKGSMNDQYTLVGNAVPPKFGELIGKTIIEFVKTNRR